MNCYVEPVYTLNADLAVEFGADAQLTQYLNAVSPESSLRIQFTKDARYQAFLPRAIEAEVLGVRVKVACLHDVTQGKLWAYLDPQRRLSKRTKDELD